MLTTSIFLLIKALVIHIFVPRIPWVLLLLLLFPNLLKWIRLHIVWWFLGVGLIANRIFDLQFIGLWGGILEYSLLILVLLIACILRIQMGGLSFSMVKESLKIEKISWIKELFSGLTSIEKKLIVIWWAFLARFFVNSFVHTVNFPSYGDDSFGNRNRQWTNIFHDNKVHLFGEKDTLLWRGLAVGYPVHISIYKANLAHFMWWWNDVYMKLFQWFWLFFIVMLSIVVTFGRTKNILTSLIPGILICGLPLIFWHSIDAYQDITSVYFTVLAIRLLYEYLESNNLLYVALASLIVRILCYVKNDGLAIYAPSIAIWFLLVLRMQGRLSEFFKSLLIVKKSLIIIVVGFILMFIPFTAIKLYHWLWLNPTQSATGAWNTTIAHREIFSVFKPMFITENNYSIALIFVILLGILFYRYYNQNNWKKTKDKVDIQTPIVLFPVFTSLLMFILFTLVFLLSENYQRIMNQTTSNRVYTMCFVVLFYFFWIVLHELQGKK